MSVTRSYICMMRVFIMTLLMALAFIQQEANAKTYYVASYGSDGNNGLSWRAPKRNIEPLVRNKNGCSTCLAGQTCACPGDNIYVKPGIYQDANDDNDSAVVTVRQTGAANNYITIRACSASSSDTGSACIPMQANPANTNQSNAVIDGQNITDVGFDIADYVSYVKILGFDIKNEKKLGVSMQDWDNKSTTTQKYLVISENYIHDIGTQYDPIMDSGSIGRAGLFINGNASNINFTRNYVGKIGNADARSNRYYCMVDGSNCYDHGVYLSTSNNIFIENNIFSWPGNNNVGWPIHIYGNGLKNYLYVRHNTFDGGTSSVTDGGAIILGVNAGGNDKITNLFVRYNIFHNPPQDYAVNNEICNTTKRNNINFNDNLTGTSGPDLTTIGSGLCANYNTLNTIDPIVYQNNTPFGSLPNSYNLDIIAHYAIDKISPIISPTPVTVDYGGDTRPCSPVTPKLNDIGADEYCVP